MAELDGHDMAYATGQLDVTDVCAGTSGRTVCV